MRTAGHLQMRSLGTVGMVSLASLVLTLATSLPVQASPQPNPAQAETEPASFDSLAPASPDLATPTIDAERTDSNLRNVPQDVPVEAIPTPSAAVSGSIGLATVAAARLFRRLRLAA